MLEGRKRQEREEKSEKSNKRERSGRDLGVKIARKCGLGNQGNGSKGRKANKEIKDRG